jgi:hypothetical protein
VPRESKRPSSSEGSNIDSSNHERRQSHLLEASSQLNSATSIAHDTDHLQGSKRVDVIRAGVTSLGTHARVLKDMSEQMTAISAKLQELQEEEELALRMVGRKRPRRDQ